MAELNYSNIEIGSKLVVKENIEVRPAMMFNTILIPKGSIMVLSRIDMGGDRDFYTIECENKDICDVSIEFESLYQFRLLKQLNSENMKLGLKVKSNVIIHRYIDRFSFRKGSEFTVIEVVEGYKNCHFNDGEPMQAAMFKCEEEEIYLTEQAYYMLDLLEE